MASLKNTVFAAAVLLINLGNALNLRGYEASPTTGPGSPDCPTPANPIPTPAIGLPLSCYVPDVTGALVGPDCYAWTELAPATTCPQIRCKAPPTDLVCPLYLKVSSTTVPCATDCCPVTPTATYSCGPCPSCDPCRIPTELTIFTTGCPGTTGVISSVTTITPPPQW